MRRILVEHARARQTKKRHGVHVPLDESAAGQPEGNVDILALDDALTRLEKGFPFESRVVQLRFFGGLTIKETAEQLDVGHATVERAWTFAKAWLYRRISGTP